MKEAPFSALVENLRSKNAPFTVVFEITNSCNLKCIHCYHGDPVAGLDLRRIRFVLEGLAQSGCLKLTLSGGEPTSRKDFLDIYTFCGDLGFAVTLFTNGTLLSHEIRKTLLKRPPYTLECSLYGATAATHDAITRTKGSFENSLTALRWMRENGVKAIVKSVMVSSNVCELGRLYELTAELGVPFRPTFRIFPSSDPLRSTSSLRVNTEDIQTLLKRKKSIQPDYAEEPEKILNQFICNAGRESCCIAADGKVYPCVALRWECGDLKEQSFGEIWSHFPVLQQIRAYEDEDFAECFHCPSKSKCDFCPGLGFSEHGNMLIPSKELCRLTKAAND